MLHHLILFLSVAVGTFIAMMAGAALLHLFPRMGAPGRRIAAAMCRAPALDILITYFTVLPLFVGPFVAGWVGFIGAIVGQVGSVLAWSRLHELAHPEAMRGPRIVKLMNRMIGRWRNHTAAWLTAIVTPMFWIIRVAEITVYPAVRAVAGLPRYKDAEWVNVSRHKFSNLVGHDRIWCLYCDWMTGVWSLGTEMLRNVESFWCPIRFSSEAKCDNCTIDFPDIAHGWINADGTMAEVTDTLERVYDGKAPGERAWFGKQVEVTVRGKPVEAEVPVEVGV